ncbi:MAG: PD-(D/E)XK nuclease family protein [Nanoarchaeota archaeon]|nr:PD-(D/E)XK nuclease family protein [Nanoarchaeota archaeon]MBU1643585.1 PD-(D/E)XK nuclease family protein [Nanoarchaeota archaeon]MBU1977181.1 PD-(D/E)XK nuclease family protein [Nanoarchaeota archaeon]
MAKRVESPSSINTFKQCPRKYYYQYIEKLPTLPNIHQVRGNIAHSTLENFYEIDTSLFDENNYKIKFKEAGQKLLLFQWTQYKEKLDELGLSKDQERFYFEETMMMIMNWINHIIKDFTVLMERKKISIPEAFQQLTPIREQKFVSDHYSVQGFIDAIHHLEDEVHIIDYKTNSSFDFKDSIRLQLAIYSLLYFEKYGQTPSKVGIFFLRNKQKMIAVDEELLELAKKEITLIHLHTSSTEEIEDYKKKITPLCRWKTGQCDFYENCNPEEK